jgi:hypothetical protein
MPDMIAIDPVVVGAISTLAGAPLALLVGICGVLGLFRRALDTRISNALDAVLRIEAEEFRRRAARDLLDFAPSGSVHAGRVGVDWGWAAGRVRVVRTVRVALHDGFRIRLRAVGRGVRGRLLVRDIDVDLHRAA